MGIKVISETNLRNKISFDDNEIFTDAPSPLGLGENLTPADMLVASFASCAMTIMAIKVSECGEKFDGCYVLMDKEVDMNEFRITKISLEFHLKATFSTKAREAVNQAFNQLCIVERSLNPNIAKEVKFIYE